MESLVGTDAPRIRRVAIDGVCGLVGFAVLLPFIGWQLAALCGWDIAGGLFVVASWHTILHADATRTRELSMREDETKRTAALLIVLSSVASLLPVALTVANAESESGWERDVSIAAALVTVVVSWTVLNTLFTLRYADAHYHDGPGVGFGDDGAEGPPDYRDFAYLAFTVGMCYQVSDQTVRSRRLRRTVLVHALVSYVFGVVIIASTVNVIVGLAS